MNCAFTSLGTLFLIAQAGFFICCTTTVGLFWGITILLKFHVPSRDFFLQSFAKFHCLWKCWRCLTYLPKMNLFPWTVFLPDGFENGIIQRFLTGDYMAWGSISLFARFLEKENPLETLIVIYEKVSPKGFSDWIWRISKFPFWRQILDIYRQPLLITSSSRHVICQ